MVHWLVGHFVPVADGQEISKKLPFEAQSYRLVQTEDTNLIRLYYYAYADRQICWANLIARLLSIRPYINQA